MTNYQAVYIANGTALLLLSVILLSNKKPLRHGLFEEKIFYGMVHVNILQCFIETAACFVDGKTAYGYRTLSLVLNVLFFINNIIFAFAWIIYLDYKMFADIRKIKRVYPIVALPAVLTVIACFINLATPVFFAVDEHNTFHRTDLFIVLCAVIYAYLAYGVILIYLYRKKAQKYLFFPSILFIIPLMIGCLLQYFFYGYSLACLGASIGMTALFINVQNEASYIDILSGLFNRHYLNNILLTNSAKTNTDCTLAGIMLDIDGFGSINDQFGHAEGDNAIAAVGKMLLTAVGNKGIICRYGGDEFVILMHISSKIEILDMTDIIKKHTALFNESEKKPYKINFSIGHSTYHCKYESIDDFLKKIDTFMYADKKRKSIRNNY